MEAETFTFGKVQGTVSRQLRSGATASDCMLSLSL